LILKEKNSTNWGLTFLYFYKKKYFFLAKLKIACGGGLSFHL